MITTDEDCLALHSKYLNICNDLSSSHFKKLWILYLKIVDLLHMNLTAECSVNWSMYLHFLRLMLPYFPRTGHNNYPRSLYWFLQKMSALNPTVHQEFKNRHFAVRRISTFWSGVYPDLYIEQTLMARSPQVPQV